MQRFIDKVVLVTGAAAGIGRATALRYAAEGAKLVACDINRAGLDALAGELGLAEDHLLVQELDVCDPVACEAAVNAAVAQFGKLDILCNIAGIAMTQHFHDTSDQDWQRILNLNLSSVFYLCRAAIPALKASRGNIVNMASIAGLMGQAYTSAYCATKGAVIMLSKSLAIEYAKDGIRVNALCPGGVNTDLVRNFSAPDDVNFELMARYMPLTEMAEADDIADAVLFVSSEQARHINGVALPLDGGVSAG